MKVTNLLLAVSLVHARKLLRVQDSAGRTIATEDPNSANLAILSQDSYRISQASLPAYPSFNADDTKSSVLSLHKALVDIPSVTGNEEAIAVWLKGYLEKLDFHVKLQELPSERDDAGILNSQSGKKRYNVLASKDKSLHTPVLLSTHIDTVPPFTPYSRTHDNGRTILHGRGSNDAKASLAAQVVALASLISNGTIDSTAGSLLFVADEEVHGLGMRTANALNSHSKPWEAVIFGEPTESRLISGHKGIVLFDVIAHGKDAHSGYPWLGESAIDMLLPVLTALRAAEAQLPHSKILGNSTLNIGTVTAGVAGNVVAADAKASIAIRIGGESVDDVRSLVEKTVRSVDDRVVVRWSGNGYGPVNCDTDIEGFELGSVNYGTDVPNLQGGHKRYLYGPGSILSAHSDHEVVDEGELIDAVDGYQRLIIGALKGLKHTKVTGETGDKDKGDL